MTRFHSLWHRHLAGRLVAPSLLATLLLALVSGTAIAQDITTVDIPGPAGSEAFGATVTVLANGNFVVTDPHYDEGGVDNIGAVYLYDGATLQEISQLTGSNAGDYVGSDGVVALPSGNFVVRSLQWGGTSGAVTFVNGVSGLTAEVSAANSLVGSTGGSTVGSGGVRVLSNGNYVVNSYQWDTGGMLEVGAVTWGSGTTGISGVVSGANSLVGSIQYDNVGYAGVTALANGNYVVASPLWSNFTESAYYGAVTWGNGLTGISGPVAPANSLIGGLQGKRIGSGGVAPLTNGNYVVLSPIWSSVLGSQPWGAATWGNGTTGITGTVSITNSLVGSNDDDYVGLGVTVLTNGNYVVVSPDWRGAAAKMGAITWGNGTTGITGTVSAANSLVGGQFDDSIGKPRVTALANGNYVVQSQYWRNGAVGHAGAVTWGDGASGTVGTVSAANSLVGTTVSDQVGLYVTALSNGNYVTYAPYWDDPNSLVVDVGAVTWASGSSPTGAVVSTANSLVGSSESDQVGLSGVLALANGNYVVASPLWDGDGTNRGAATWGIGTAPLVGVVSDANSLIGMRNNDQISEGRIVALSNGNYVVSSPLMDVGGLTDAGALTWANGATGGTGVVTTTNSLVGVSASDLVGRDRMGAVANGTFLVRSAWFDGPAADSGAVILGYRQGGITSPMTGTVTSANSILGTVAGGGATLNFTYNPTRDWIGVGRPADKIVTIVRFIWPLEVSLLGSGLGEVTSEPAGIACGVTCASTLQAGSIVTLTASAGLDSAFTGWGGACAGTNPVCTLSADSHISVTASFAPVQQLTLHVSKGGSIIASTAPGNSDDTTCGAATQCSQVLVDGTVITLTAASELGNHFVEWRGDPCEPDGDALLETCALTIDASKAITAIFAANAYSLTMLFAGNGHGDIDFAVAESDAALDECDDGSANCVRTIHHGDQLTITATPEEGSQFDGFMGGCSLVTDVACVVEATAPLTLTAHFSIKVFEVSVAKSGEGKGSIEVSAPEGLCASKAPCVFTTTYGSDITLQATALPSTGSRFGGWGGACSGSEPTCTVTITQTTTVTGAFGLAQWSLAVSTSGLGVVTSLPAGINCGSGVAGLCSSAFAHGTNVVLVATPANGNVFTGWTLFCSGKSTCSVPMTQSRAVQAVFQPKGQVDPDPEYRNYLPAIHN